MTLRGIDVSNWQGVIDWKAVKASGIAFAFIKATEGTDFVDPHFLANWQGAKAAGVVRGAYHFARDNQPEAEAAYFSAQVLPHLASGDLIALDDEVTHGLGSAWICRWMTSAHLRLGCAPLYYANLSAIQTGALPPVFGEFGLWLADYTDVAPAAPAPWSLLAFWQHSSSGNVPGIVGPVDLDTFFGDSAQLAKYGKRST